MKTDPFIPSLDYSYQLPCIKHKMRFIDNNDIDICVCFKVFVSSV